MNTDPTEEKPVMFIKRPAWWNLVARYRWWRVLRDLKAGIYVHHYYVPGDDRDNAN